MSGAPDPRTVYRRAVDDGHRRLAMTPLEKVATGFIAGVTVVFGIVASGVVTALAAPRLGAEMAKIAGALAFGIGLVFVVVGRSELFTENLVGPVAAAIDEGARGADRLGSLWITMLVLNLVGGAALMAALTVEGALPPGASEALAEIAEEIAAKAAAATFVRAVLAGTLIALLSFMLHACDTVGSQVALAFTVGAFLALGPFDHVVVSALHLLFGWWESDVVGVGDVLSNLGLSALGNVVGGLLLVTFTHTAQAKAR